MEERIPTWKEMVQEPENYIYRVWEENIGYVSYWSTFNGAVNEVSRLKCIPSEQLMFEKGSNEWENEWKLITSDDSDPKIWISEIPVDIPFCI